MHIYRTMSLTMLCGRRLPLAPLLRVSPFSPNSPLQQRSSAVTRLCSSGSKPHSEDTYESYIKKLESSSLGKIAPNTQALSYLASLLAEDDLNLLPDYQRGYVWKPEKASRLVVTAICNRMIPSIVVHEKKKGVFDVVDGKQRLTALLSFYLAAAKPDLYSKLQKGNRLSGEFSTLQKLDEDYESLNGLTYNQMSTSRQKAFKGYQLPVVTIPYEASPKDVFCVYEDINSGGEDLSKQQLRRAAFWGDNGKYIKLLDKLAENEDFQQIRDRKAFDQKRYKLDEREQDRELILRAFAFSANGQNFKIPVKNFLNVELEKHVREAPSLNKQLAEKEEGFEFVLKVCNNIFTDEDGAFRVWSESKKTGEMEWGKKISNRVFDISYPAFVELKVTYTKVQQYTNSKADIVAAVKNTFENGELDAILAGGMTAKKFETGKGIIKSALLEALKKNNPGVTFIGTRNFNLSKQEMESLYVKQGGICQLCNETIDKRLIFDGGRVELDHKKPVSKGGTSEIENCQLLHTECNRRKSNKYQDEYASM